MVPRCGSVGQYWEDRGMKVLIGCELSGVVRRVFRACGHDAFSCDLEDADDYQEHHLKCDIYEAVASAEWDIIIMHPPCTALAVSGNRWYGQGMPKHRDRMEAISWTWGLYKYSQGHSDRVCMENPVGVLPHKPTQYIQPWQFGHGETKKTGLWLWNLPKLKPTNIVEGREARVHRMPPGPDRAKMRSQTYQGIADAMAEQWG